MDIDLFEGMAKAFRRYQAEMAEQAQASGNPIPTGLEAEKTEKKIEGNFTKQECFDNIRVKAAFR